MLASLLLVVKNKRSYFDQLVTFIFNQWSRRKTGTLTGRLRVKSTINTAFCWLVYARLPKPVCLLALVYAVFITLVLKVNWMHFWNIYTLFLLPTNRINPSIILPIRQRTLRTRKDVFLRSWEALQLCREYIFFKFIIIKSGLQ